MRARARSGRACSWRWSRWRRGCAPGACSSTASSAARPRRPPRSRPAWRSGSACAPSAAGSRRGRPLCSLHAHSLSLRKIRGEVVRGGARRRLGAPSACRAAPSPGATSAPACGACGKCVWVRMPAQSPQVDRESRGTKLQHGLRQRRKDARRPRTTSAVVLAHAQHTRAQHGLCHCPCQRRCCWRPDSILRTVSTLTLSAPLHGPCQRAILLAHWINPAHGACRRRTWSGRPLARSARRRRRARRAARARRSSRGSGGRRSRRMRPTTTTTWPTTARRRAPPRARAQPEDLKGFLCQAGVARPLFPRPPAAGRPGPRSARGGCMGFDYACRFGWCWMHAHAPEPCQAAQLTLGARCGRPGGRGAGRRRGHGASCELQRPRGPRARPRASRRRARGLGRPPPGAR